MKKFFSHHELAMLILLLHAPAQVSMDSADLAILRQERLVEVVALEDDFRARLTPSGTAALRRLGIG